MAAVGPGELGETTGIWAISILGGAPRKLRDDAGRASVSPNGEQIAYIAGRQESELWVMGANGEQPKKLLQAATGDRILQVQWVPDGKRIAYMKSHTDAEKSETTVETVPLAGGVSTTILADPGLRSFCWPSDGRIIYSIQERPPNDKDMNLWELRVDPSSGKTPGRPRRLTRWAGLSLLDLSLTADGKRLVFVTAGLQSDVYVGEFGSGVGLGTPRRFTLEERNDVPSAWTPDGQTLFFHSDRNGNWNIFKQRLHERKAQDFVLGSGGHTEARLGPGAVWVLYWDNVETGAVPPPRRLLRVPISGGAPEVVLEAKRGAAFRCAAAGSRCALSEPDKANGELVLSAFDPVRGRSGELVRLANDSAGSPVWDLSPDGSTVAIVDLDEHKDRIRLIELETGSGRSIPVGRSMHLSGISWSADGTGLFVTGSSVRGAALLQVRLSGAVSEMWTTSTVLGAPVASPDGKNLAFSVSTNNGNAWMIENF
ncbi:MAG: hypothetical protein ACRD2Y_08430 [Terriglobales bacterium]